MPRATNSGDNHTHDEAFGGVETTPECETDAGCAESPHESTCFFRVCQAGIACAMDDDCPSDEPYCSRETVCYVQP